MSINARIDRALKQFSDSQIPLSTLMRWIVVIGILLRILRHNNSSGINLLFWEILLVVYVLYTTAISLFILLKKTEIKDDKLAFFGQLLVDGIFCGTFFILSGNAESDLYLNLLLPLMIILEHVHKAHLLLLYYFGWSLFLLVVLIIIVALCKTGCTYQEIIFNTFLPRVTLFLFFILFVISRNNLIRT